MGQVLACLGFLVPGTRVFFNIFLLMNDVVETIGCFGQCYRDDLFVGSFEMADDGDVFRVFDGDVAEVVSVILGVQQDFIVSRELWSAYWGS